MSLYLCIPDKIQDTKVQTKPSITTETRGRKAGCHSYHGLDALGVEEAVVNAVHGVVGLHVTLLLQQDGACVQPIVSPENGEAGLLIPLDQSPGEGDRGGR